MKKAVIFLSVTQFIIGLLTLSLCVLFFTKVIGNVGIIVISSLLCGLISMINFSVIIYNISKNKNV